jgi:hypothetical protein
MVRGSRCWASDFDNAINACAAGEPTYLVAPPLAGVVDAGRASRLLKK